MVAVCVYSMDMASTTHHKENAMTTTDQQLDVATRVFAEIIDRADAYRQQGMTAKAAMAKAFAEFENWADKKEVVA